MRKSSGQNTWKLREMTGALALNYAEVVLGAIERHYRPLRNAPKLLARQADVSPRSAENWLSGKNAPNGDALVKLMAHNDELAAEIFALVAEMRAARK